MFKPKLVNSVASSVWFRLCLIVGVSFLASAQSAPSATRGKDSDPDASEYLKQASSRYLHLQYYHIESIEETQVDNDSQRISSKSRYIAVVTPGNRYRFESISGEGTNMQVSDGKNEWLYDAFLQHYMQHPSPATGYENPVLPTMSLRQVQFVQAIVRNLSNIQNDAGPAYFLADEILDLDGTRFPCRVILVLPKVNAEGTEQSPGLSIYWIDKETHVFRKIWERFESKEEGGFTPGRQVLDTTTVYPVAELGTSSPPDSLFSFTSPLMATQVAKFEDPFEKLLKSGAEDKPEPPTGVRKSAAANPLAKSDSGAFAYLRQAAERYAHATYFHIETEEKSQGNSRFGEISRKARRISILEPGNRYRFEVIGRQTFYLQVSNGKTEWIYEPASGQYTEQAVPASGPGKTKLPFPMSMVLDGARDLAKNLAKVTDDVTAALFLPDETIDLDGHKHACRVVIAEHKTSSALEDDKASGIVVSIYWIDKETLAFRKVSSHADFTSYGSYRPGQSTTDTVTTYPVVELGPSTVPDSEFGFTPPATASRVAKFDQREFHTAEIENKPAPEITFHSEDGKTMLLQSWRGKPVLLDFWATWCGPCIASLPGVEKIYHEFENKGLAVISVDEDQSAKDATDFLVDHKRPWPNFHDKGGKIRGSFPKKGIPYFVLIDATGKIAYASSGFFDEELRAALAKLGPEFATPITASKP